MVIGVQWTPFSGGPIDIFFNGMKSGYSTKVSTNTANGMASLNDNTYQLGENIIAYGQRQDGNYMTRLSASFPLVPNNYNVVGPVDLNKEVSDYRDLDVLPLWRTIRVNHNNWQFFKNNNLTDYYELRVRLFPSSEFPKFRPLGFDYSTIAIDTFNLYGYLDYYKAEIGRSIDVPKREPIWVEISSVENPQSVWDLWQNGWDLYPFGQANENIGIGGTSTTCHFDQFLVSFDLNMTAQKNGRQRT